MPAELVVVKGSHRGGHAAIGSGPITIGRSRGADLCLAQDTKVSSLHARVVPLGPERWVLEDLQSTNGSYVNDERVEQAPLRSGDLIKLGRSLLIFRADSTVQVADVALSGGGSSADIRPGPGDPASSSASPAGGPGGADAPASDAPAAPSPAAEAAPEEPAAELRALQDVVLAGGAGDAGASQQRALAAVLQGSGGARVLVFLRQGLAGTLGCVASHARATPAPAGPVEREPLHRALNGEVFSAAGAVAAPLLVHGLPLGVLYVDGRAPEAPAAPALRLVAAGGVLLGLITGADRARRLAGAATEVAWLAHAAVTPRPVDLADVLAGAERLFAPPTRARGLAWEASAAPGLTVRADPLLLGRGLDRLIEHVLGVTRDGARLTAAPLGAEVVQLRVVRRRVEAPEVVPALLDPEGVTSDLRRAARALDDGALAVARAAFARTALEFRVALEGDDVVYQVDLEADEGGEDDPA